MEKASGSKTSVYTGCFTEDYKFSLLKDMAMIPKYAATGVAVSMLAARLSWFFNFTGPCVNLDSACSSSFMAFDLACQGLRNGDTEMVKRFLSIFMLLCLSAIRLLLQVVIWLFRSKFLFLYLL